MSEEETTSIINKVEITDCMDAIVAAEERLALASARPAAIEQAKRNVETVVNGFPVANSYEASDEDILAYVVNRERLALFGLVMGTANQEIDHATAAVAAALKQAASVLVPILSAEQAKFEEYVASVLKELGTGDDEIRRTIARHGTRLAFVGISSLDAGINIAYSRPQGNDAEKQKMRHRIMTLLEEGAKEEPDFVAVVRALNPTEGAVY